MTSHAFESFARRLNDVGRRRRKHPKSRRGHAPGRPSNWGCAAETLEDRLLLSGTPPTVTAPTTATTDAWEPYNFASMISVTDAYATGTSDSASVTVGHGIVTLGSVTGITFTQGANA